MRKTACLNLIVSSCLAQVLCQEESSLRLVHVIFRHGDRTTDSASIYPNDPYKNETYYPYGRGELTNKGKKRSYELGKYLRSRYNDFLGTLYTPDILEATSSDLNRTKSTLELVLAGLFPPEGSQIWEEKLAWQPIPYNFLPKNQDRLFFGVLCPNFECLTAKLRPSPKFANELRDFRPVFDYLTLKTGWKMEEYTCELLYLYSGLQTVEEFGLPLPEWTKLVYPELLREMVMRFYTFVTYTDPLKRLTSGYLLEKILLDTVRKIDGSLVPNGRKIFLYSGHEYTLAFMLKGLRVPFETVPYSAFLIFELHQIGDIFGYKIFYQDYREAEPKLLSIPGCYEFCPMGKFFALVKQHLPLDNSCGNES